MRKLVLTSLMLALCSSTAFADTQRPSVVSNVAASALSNDSVRLSWSKPWDNIDVVGYNIYRNGQYFSTVFNTTNFLDTGLSTATQYLYSVVAFDEARNYSTLSYTTNVTTQGGSSSAIAAAPINNSAAPGTPSDLRAEINSASEATLSWSAASGSVSGYNLYRDGSYYTTIKGDTQYKASSLNSNQVYRFAVVAFNGDQYSNKSSEIQVQTSGTSSVAVSSSVSSSTGSVPDGYNLVFSEEFQSQSLDSSKWNSRYRWGPEWTINNEQQYYVDHLSDPNFGHSPFEFDGEHMSIVASATPDWLKSKANNKSYLSGALTTYQKFTMKYGYVEIRAKLPQGQGLWPAFWLLHNTEDGKRPEIDVVEMLGKQPSLAYQTYHYYDNWSLRSSPSFEAWGSDYSQAFHTFGMKWEPGRITWYVDGEATNSFSDGNVADEDMYLLVNLALGGSWGGNVDGSTPFPAKFTIDYIRAYSQN